MLKLRDGIVELMRKVATSLPPDVKDALTEAHSLEAEGSACKDALSVILESEQISRSSSRALCQDTGVPVFYVKIPTGLSHSSMRETITEATRLATEKVPLRPNSVDVLTDKNTGDNTGTGVPVINIEEALDSNLVIDLMLKGSGCENQGQLYKLPVEAIGAERDLEGVRRCVLDAAWRAQGKGCPPYTLGVGIAGTKDQASVLAKQQLLRRLTDESPHESIAELEGQLLKELNTLGIGPLGFGGATTALGVKIGVNNRHPASFFVDISVCCWANRRGRLIW